MIKNIKMIKTFYAVIFASFHFYTVHHSDLKFNILNIDYETIKNKKPMNKEGQNQKELLLKMKND